MSDTQELKKADSGKRRYSLLDWDAMNEMVDVMEAGAKKYADHNWLKGTDWNRYWDAAMRHMIAWKNGEENDPEDSKSHLSHAMCCMMFLQAYQRKGIGTDNRKATPSNTPN